MNGRGPVRPRTSFDARRSTLDARRSGAKPAAGERTDEHQSEHVRRHRRAAIGRNLDSIRNSRRDLVRRRVITVTRSRPSASSSLSFQIHANAQRSHQRAAPSTPAARRRLQRLRSDGQSGQMDRHRDGRGARPQLVDGHRRRRRRRRQPGLLSGRVRHDAAERRPLVLGNEQPVRSRARRVTCLARLSRAVRRLSVHSPSSFKFIIRRSAATAFSCSISRPTGPVSFRRRTRNATRNSATSSVRVTGRRSCPPNISCRTIRSCTFFCSTARPSRSIDRSCRKIKRADNSSDNTPSTCNSPMPMVRSSGSPSRKAPASATRKSTSGGQWRRSSSMPFDSPSFARSTRQPSRHSPFTCAIKIRFDFSHR
jgi:hypothetical protein